MQVEQFELGPIMTNAYLLYDPVLKAGVVIDPGQNPKKLIDRITELNVNIVGILLTHAHFDHIGGLEELRELTQADVYVHVDEKEWLTDPELNGSGLWPGLPSISCRPADKIVYGDEELHLLNRTFQVLHTPGHSPGSVSYITKEGVFSGDVLFKGSVGRTDLPGGDYNQLKETLHTHFLTMPMNTSIYPGHGLRTTISDEKAHNPFLN